jgi:hypothetical protein
MAPSRLALTICGVLAWWVVPAAAGAATPRFGETVVLRAPSTLSAGEPAVAVSGSGGIVAAWDQQFSRRAFGIVIRRGTTSGRFAAAERVTLPVAGATQTGVVVAWATGNFGRYGLHHAVRPARGTFGTARALTTSHAEQGALLASSSGTVVAVWTMRPGAAGPHPQGARRGIALAILRELD